MLTNKFHSGAMLQLRQKRCRVRKAGSVSPPFPALWRALSPAGFLPMTPSLRCQNSFQGTRVINSSNMTCLEEGDEDDYGNCHDWVLETCITRVLPQALTLEHGLEALKDAINELKLNPPTTSSGLIRFEVAVPPCSKPFIWFCTEPESSEVFPQFYISKVSNMASHQSVYLNNSHGIFGIGAAVDFGHLSSGDIGNWDLFRSFLQILDG